MLYGFNPILPAYGTAGATWGSKVPSRDYSVFGVTGSTRILGLRTVKVGNKTYSALAVRVEADAEGLQVRQRHADELLRRRQGSRQARLPPR